IRAAFRGGDHGPAAGGIQKGAHVVAVVRGSLEQLPTAFGAGARMRSVFFRGNRKTERAFVGAGAIVAAGNVADRRDRSVIRTPVDGAVVVFLEKAPGAP